MKPTIRVEIEGGVGQRVTLEDGTEIPGISAVHIDVPGGHKAATATLEMIGIELTGTLVARLTEDGVRFFEKLIAEWKAEDEARKRSEGPTA